MIRRRPTKPIAIGAAAAVLGLLCLLAIAACSSDARPSSSHARASSSHARPRIGIGKARVAKRGKQSTMYTGAWIGDQITGTAPPYDMNAVHQFAGMIGKGLSIVEWAQPFADCSGSSCNDLGFPTSSMQDVRNYGAIPMLSWSSASVGPPNPVQQPDFQLSDVISGRYDNFIRSFATSAKAWGHPYFLRFDWEMNSIRAHGSIPFLSWSSQSIPWASSEPDFQLSDVISGRYDSYIRSFATAAKNWGHPFFLRFNWEMNGGWFAWGERANGNQPGEYVAAWRHVHDIFTSVGATNASWVWCPNVDPDHKLTPLAGLYPGDAYVDWTCLDGYNWGPNPASPKGWKSFDQLFSSDYNLITGTIARAKPMVIGEFGSSEYGGSKSAWIQDALARIPAYTKIRAVQYFEKYDDGMD